VGGCVSVIGATKLGGVLLSKIYTGCMRNGSHISSAVNVNYHEYQYYLIRTKKPQKSGFSGYQ
jgi:hypothetical protein